MKVLVDEIREAGKYVFRNNKNRLKGYSSDYWKMQNRKKRTITVKILNNSVLLRFGAPCLFLTLPVSNFCFPVQQELKKTEQENKKHRRNDQKHNRDTKKNTEIGKITTGRQKSLKENVLS